MPKRALAPLFLFAALCFAGQASAATFTVDNGTDNTIFSGATTCDSPCTLYQAITSSNNTPGTKDTIQFSVHHINLATPLPGIVDPVTIDGGTSSGKPATELSGATGVGGFILEAPNSTIENLVLNHFDGSGIAVIDGPNAHPESDLIAGNYIGTNASGTSCSDGSNTGNADSGIVIAHGTGHQVGGFDAAERNVIACNTGAGVTVGANGSEAGVYNNDIGLLANGNSGSGQTTGVSVSSGGSTIGTTPPGAGNVISGNTQDGIDVAPGTDEVQIDANYIGTDPTGTLARGNGRYGIDLTGTAHEVAQNVIAANGGDGLHLVDAAESTVSDNNIGRGLPAGGEPGLAAHGQDGAALGNGGSGIHGAGDVEAIHMTQNVIANNTGDGLLLDAPTGSDLVQDNDVADNYYSSNGLLGIDMGGDGVTLSPIPGDTAAADLGQELPVLTAVSTTNGQTTVQGTYHSLHNSYYDIAFYPVASCDPSGYGEGEITSFNDKLIQTDSSGNATFTKELPFAIPPGSYVTATAADTGTFNTSEFSRCLRVPGATIVSTDPATAISLTGATLNGSVNPDGVDAHAHFEWGATTSYGSSTPDEPVGSDSSSHAISVSLAGLPPGTTFHYRGVTSNAVGHNAAGPDRTFTTLSPAAPPAAPVAPRKKARCVVPHLKGKSLASIKRSLKQAHCRLGKVTHKHRHGKKKGRDLSQSLKPGKHRPAGTKVNVVLAK